MLSQSRQQPPPVDLRQGRGAEQGHEQSHDSGYGAKATPGSSHAQKCSRRHLSPSSWDRVAWARPAKNPGSGPWASSCGPSSSRDGKLPGSRPCPQLGRFSSCVHIVGSPGGRQPVPGRSTLLVAGGGEVSSPGPSFFRVANTEPLSAHLLLRSLVHILRVSVTSDGRECRAAASSRFRCLRPVQILRIGVELELGVV